MGVAEEGDGHAWVPRHSPRENEHRYPPALVKVYADRMLAALQSGRVKMRPVWRLNFSPKTPNGGRVRCDREDSVLTSSLPPLAPDVVLLRVGVQLSGGFDAISCQFPHEAADQSTWIAGHPFAWEGGSSLLVTDPYRGGRANMRLPQVRKTKEWRALPLERLQEPVLVDHRCAGRLAWG